MMRRHLIHLGLLVSVAAILTACPHPIPPDLPQASGVCLAIQIPEERELCEASGDLAAATVRVSEAAAALRALRGDP